MKQAKRQRKDGGRKILRIFLVLVCLGALAAVATSAYVVYLYKTLPNPSSIGERIVTQSTKIYDRTGENLLYEIHGEENRTVVKLEDLPEYVKQATIAIEDEGFYQHPAFDWRGIIRAFFVNLKTGKISQGGSTITQQFVKKAFLSDERTITRKIKEVILAIKLEKNYSKDQILELYLNQIPYGSNAYGVEAASQTYFNKHAKDLTLAESAILAALIQAPSYYSPYGNHIKELMARKDGVLDKMAEYGFIDAEELNRAKKETLEFSPKFEGLRAPHFVMFVKEYLESKYGSDYVETAGLKVITTLDWNLQQLAEKVVAEGAQRNEELYKGKNAALIAQDPKTGQILAMVGSRDYFDLENEGNFNVVTGHRQPGSSFKPFAYLTAFQKGYTPETIVFDLKTEFNPDCSWTATDEKDKYGLDCYHPSNYDLNFRGPIDLRHALAQSVNVPAVKVLYLAGINNTIQTAQKFGITTLTETGRYGLSLVLGGGDVRPIDMAEAYSVFAQDGQKHEQAAILKVEDPKGRILENYEDKSEKAYESQYIRMVNDILADNEARLGLFAPNNLLEIPGYQVAAKTGTTQDYRDAWVAGYTPSLVAVVWAGNNDFSPMQKGAAGILAAVPIWHNFMVEAIKTMPAESFPKPEAISANKPILNGQYLSNFKIGDKIYPQIHNILFWLDKNNPQGAVPENPANDSQFNNWEQPVLNWVQTHLPNPNQYNEQVPTGYGELIGNQQAPKITISNPQNGSFLQGATIQFRSQIESAFGIKSIKLYFNDVLINEATSAPNNNYWFDFTPVSVDAQNKIKITVTDTLGNSNEAYLIIFKQ